MAIEELLRDRVDLLGVLLIYGVVRQCDWLALCRSLRNLIGLGYIGFENGIRVL